MRQLHLAAFLCLAAVGSLWLPSGAAATPIGPTCGTCQGSIYELSYGGTAIAVTATTETFRITYTIDTPRASRPHVRRCSHAARSASARACKEGSNASWT